MAQNSGGQSTPYREDKDRLGAEVREAEAVRGLGRLRDRTRTAVLAGFGIAGVAAGALGYWYIEQAQFKYNHGVAVGFANFLGAVGAWTVMFTLGYFVSRRVVAARMPGWIDRLARDYEVPRDRIEATANMLRKL